MVEKIDGNVEMLLTREESELFERQVQAQTSADVSKTEARYQNEPNDGEQCSGCSMFVPGFLNDVGNFCTKVYSYRGPEGMIFSDGWCKFFKAAILSSEDLDEIIEGLE